VAFSGGSADIFRGRGNRIDRPSQFRLGKPTSCCKTPSTGGRTMKTLSAAAPITRSRVADYLELTKPRIAILVLFTVAIGGWLAGLRDGDALVLFHTVCATALIAGGASALNQLLERHSDALMTRTENRPLPAGRLQPAEVMIFGLVLGLGGL